MDDVKIFAPDLDNPRPLESREVEHANGAEEMDICHFSPKSEDMSISDDYVMEAIERTDEASSAYIVQVDFVAHTGSEVLLQKSSRCNIRNCPTRLGSTNTPSGAHPGAERDQHSKLRACGKPCTRSNSCMPHASAHFALRPSLSLSALFQA